MSICTVQKVEFNTKGPGRTGTYDGHTIYTISEGGSKRIDFIFKSREQGDSGSVVQDLAVGDKISMKLVKNGDYTNLSRDKDAIQLIEKSNSSGAKNQSTIPSYAKEDQMKQMMIIKQNALTNATNLVSAMLDKGIFPAKVCKEVLVSEVLNIATEFAKFASGESAIEELTKDEPKVGIKKIVKEAPPFESKDEFGA